MSPPGPCRFWTVTAPSSETSRVLCPSSSKWLLPTWSGRRTKSPWPLQSTPSNSLDSVKWKKKKKRLKVMAQKIKDLKVNSGGIHSQSKTVVENNDGEFTVEAFFILCLDSVCWNSIRRWSFSLCASRRVHFRSPLRRRRTETSGRTKSNVFFLFGWWEKHPLSKWQQQFESNR